MPGTYVEASSEEGSSEQASLPFDPSPSYRQYTPLFNDNFTPKYLYRLVAPQSAGTTTASTSVPSAITRSETDIFHLPTLQAAKLLLNHLLWQQAPDDGCSLMSWTSSLLFALQYALYRHRKDGADLKHIQLIIIDTTLFPPGTFIQDLEIMRSFQGVDRRLQKFVEFRESEYYFGEYITQGRLEIQNRSVCTSMQKMIDLQLFELQPALADTLQWHSWPKRVLEFREQFIASEYVSTTDKDVEIAFDIATQCFGGQWTVPAAIMLLALLPRKKDDTAIIEGFTSRYNRTEIRNTGMHRMKVDARRLPEVRQFQDLVQSVQRSYSVSDHDSLVDSVRGLSV